MATLCLVIFSKACFRHCSLVELPWCCLLACGKRWSVLGGGQSPVAFLRWRGSMACVFVGLLLGKLWPDTVALQFCSDSL
jgi:hypothetical protein